MANLSTSLLLFRNTVRKVVNYGIKIHMAVSPLQILSWIVLHLVVSLSMQASILHLDTLELIMPEPDLQQITEAHLPIDQ